MKVPGVMQGCVLAILILVGIGGSAWGQFSITGHVTDNLLAPVGNVTIVLYDEFGVQVGIPPTVTTSAGDYAIASVPSGTYGVGFEPKVSNRLVSQTVSPVVVSGNTVVNATLAAGVFLQGFVRDSNGVGIPNIDLNIYDQSTGAKLVTPSDKTDAFGAYKIVIPVGTLRVRWRPVGGEALVAVEQQNVIASVDMTIDIVMYWGLVLSGQVTNAAMVPLANVNMDVVNSTTGIKLFTPSGNTDASGNYSVVIPGGTYDVIAKPIPATFLVANQVSSVVVMSNTTVNLILQSGFSLSGTIKNASNAGVPNVNIDVYTATTGVKLTTPGDNTDATGLYMVIVPPGTYNVHFTPLVASHLASAVQNSVVVSGNTILNATVANGILISASVKDNLNAPVPNVDFDAKIPATNFSVPLSGDLTDATGAFTTVVAPGVYHLELEPPWASRLVAVRVPNRGISNDTTLIVSMLAGVIVSGTVKDQAGKPVIGVDVDAIKSATTDTIFTPVDKTDLLGHYQILIPTGSYRMVYKPTLASGLPEGSLNGVIVTTDMVVDITLSGTLPNCCAGRTGNVDGDASDIVDISDMFAMIDYLGAGVPLSPCLDEDDANQDGTIDISDLFALIDHLTGMLLLPFCL